MALDNSYVQKVLLWIAGDKAIIDRQICFSALGDRDPGHCAHDMHMGYLFALYCRDDQVRGADSIF